MVIRLPNLPTRTTEKDWGLVVEAALPATLGALLDAMSCGLRTIGATPTPNIRMADFAHFIVAAEDALPWEPGSFTSAYQRSRLDVNTALADGDSVASAIGEFIDASTEWSGLVSELYLELTALVDQRRPPDWPANPRWFGDRLRRAAPVLRSLGIEYRDRRTAGGTEVTLVHLAPLATSGLSLHDITDANGANVAREPVPFMDLTNIQRSARRLAFRARQLPRRQSKELPPRQAASRLAY